MSHMVAVILTSRLETFSDELLNFFSAKARKGGEK